MVNYLLQASNLIGVILHNKIFLYIMLLPSLTPKLTLLFPLGFATFHSIYIEIYLIFLIL